MPPTLGQLLRHVRRRRGVSQRQLAELLGVSQPLVALWEQDARSPELSVLVTACRLLDLRLATALRLADGKQRSRWRERTPRLGAALRGKRQAGGRLLVDVASAAGVTPGRLHQIEGGRSPLPGELCRLCVALDCSPEVLMPLSLDGSVVLPKVPSSQRSGRHERTRPLASSGRNHRT